MRVLLLLLLIANIEAQEIPSWLRFFTSAQSMNGSSATGRCSNVTSSNGFFICHDPISSVVYDGIIPTLTGLDGNMWASQLLIINTINHTPLEFDFAETPNFAGVKRVEMVVFNCAEWGSLLSRIALETEFSLVSTTTPAVSSCESLVRVCIPDLSTSPAETRLILRFSLSETRGWVYIGEVGFYNDSSTCPEDTVIFTTLSATQTTVTPDVADETIFNDATTAQRNTVICPASPSCPNVSLENSSCSTSTTLASVITAITTALLATLIFVLLQIALCKYHFKLTPGKPESAALAGGEEEVEYETMDGGGEDMAVNDPTYMEVGDEEVKVIVELKQNEAYGTAIEQ